MPKGPRREPPAPKRSRRTGSAAGAGVLRNAPGTGRMGVMAAMLYNVRAWAPERAARHSGHFLTVSLRSLGPGRPDEAETKNSWLQLTAAAAEGAEKSTSSSMLVQD